MWNHFLITRPSPPSTSSSPPLSIAFLIFNKAEGSAFPIFLGYSAVLPGLLKGIALLFKTGFLPTP